MSEPHIQLSVSLLPSPTLSECGQRCDVAVILGLESRPAPSKETMEPILRSTGNAHARRIDEALGVIVDAAAPPAAMRMNVELSGSRCRGIGLRSR